MNYPITDCIVGYANFVEWNSSTWKKWKKFLLNRKVSNLSFGNIKFDWKFLGHPYKSQNFKSRYNKNI